MLLSFDATREFGVAGDTPRAINGGGGCRIGAIHGGCPENLPSHLHFLSRLGERGFKAFKRGDGIVCASRVKGRTLILTRRKGQSPRQFL